MRKTKASPRLDRFGTLNAFVQTALAELTKESQSSAPGLVWFVLFSMADGRTGRVRRVGTRTLASVTGLARNTVCAAIKKLTDANLVVPEAGGGYHLPHMTKDD